MSILVDVISFIIVADCVVLNALGRGIKCVLLVDETQLRGKGYDKTPDYVLQVPVGKYEELSVEYATRI